MGEGTLGVGTPRDPTPTITNGLNMKIKTVFWLFILTLPVICKAEINDHQKNPALATGLHGKDVSSRTDREIQAVFDHNKRKLYMLYNKALKKNKNLKGKMILQLTIKPSGKVSNIKRVTSTLNDSEFVKKMMDEIREFDFGRKNVPAVTIRYPIELLPAN